MEQVATLVQGQPFIEQAPSFAIDPRVVSSLENISIYEAMLDQAKTEREKQLKAQALMVAAGERQQAMEYAMRQQQLAEMGISPA